jgi:hypothetical protein
MNWLQGYAYRTPFPYKDGKMIGDWFQYGDKGQVMSHGFGTEIKNYEKSLNTDLTYCILSIAQIKNEFSYATLYMDNEPLFNDQEITSVVKEYFRRLCKQI